MMYEWMGRRAHKRYINVFTTTGRGKTRVARVDVIRIPPGEVFEPTADELKYFPDLLRPIGSSLRAAFEAGALGTGHDEESEESEENEGG